MNNIIIEEYIIGAENIEVRYYIDGELFGRAANVPTQDYERWSVEHGYIGVMETDCYLSDGGMSTLEEDVNIRNYEDYWRGWAIREHLTQYLTENPLYMTDIPLYCKLWYSLCTWCANAFGSPQIR